MLDTTVLTETLQFGIMIFSKYDWYFILGSLFSLFSLLKKGYVMNFNPFVVIASIYRLKDILDKLGGEHAPTKGLIDFLKDVEPDSEGNYVLQDVWLESWYGGTGLMSDKFELKQHLTFDTANDILTVRQGDEVVWSCELETYTLENGDKGLCTKGHLKDFEYQVYALNQVLETKKSLENFVQELTKIVEGFSYLTPSN